MSKMTSLVYSRLNNLGNWAESNSIPMERLSRINKMLKVGSRGERKSGDSLQFPDYYIMDSQAKGWHDKCDYPWTKELENSFELIRKEALNIFQNKLMIAHPQDADLAIEGAWQTFFFYKNGTRFSENMLLCPVTASIIDKIPGCDKVGRVYFSAMIPGTHIKPHCGPHNFKLRFHLGIVTDPAARIRVGNDVREWEEGKIIVFDDSFEHEVWNNSNITRIVMIIDVWNPCLSNEEIQALLHIGIPAA